jgi:AcrR family transcriptional regulator
MPARTPPDASRRNPKARAAILEAARELVLADGYARLTMKGIAARAGVGKQTDYRWWSSPGAVVFEAFLGFDGDADGSPSLPDTGNLDRDLSAVVRATVEELREPRFDAVFRVLAAEIQVDARLADEFASILLRPQMHATIARLESARSAGQVRRGIDLGVAVDFLFGPIFRRWMLRTGPLDRAFADAVVTMALRGLRPSESRRRAAVQAPTPAAPRAPARRGGRRTAGDTLRGAPTRGRPRPRPARRRHEATRALCGSRAGRAVIRGAW